MLTPPPADRFNESILASALQRGWGLRPVELQHRALGFGSHHWEFADAAGARWFVNVDDLGRAPAERARGLHAALATAIDLRDAGADFVIAPIATSAGEPFVTTDGGFAVALYPYVKGESYPWEAYEDDAHRRGVLDLVARLHTAPAPTHRHALADDFGIPDRTPLEQLCDAGPDGSSDAGPYARRTAALLTAHAGGVRRLLARFDELVAAARALPEHRTLTHGEPHPGNTIRTEAGWVLIDWDTALIAPPERDLWLLDPGDGSLAEDYARATGVSVLPQLLTLYRVRWDVADLAAFAIRLTGPHRGDREDALCWDLLQQLIARLPS